MERIPICAYATLPAATVFYAWKKQAPINFMKLGILFEKPGNFILVSLNKAIKVQRNFYIFVLLRFSTKTLAWHHFSWAKKEKE